jgi:hypothetical protein
MNRVLDIQGSLNAVSHSPDKTKVVVAGRDGTISVFLALMREVLKLVSVLDGGTLVYHQNLHSGKMNLSYNGNDVSWHPQERESNIFTFVFGAKRFPHRTQEPHSDSSNEWCSGDLGFEP